MITTAQGVEVRGDRMKVEVKLPAGPMAGQWIQIGTPLVAMALLVPAVLVALLACAATVEHNPEPAHWTAP